MLFRLHFIKIFFNFWKSATISIQISSNQRIRILLSIPSPKIFDNLYSVPIPRSRAAHPSIGLIIVHTPIGNERSKSGYNIDHLPQRSFLPINHIVVEPICQSYSIPLDSLSRVHLSRPIRALRLDVNARPNRKNQLPFDRSLYINHETTVLKSFLYVDLSLNSNRSQNEERLDG